MFDLQGWPMVDAADVSNVLVDAADVSNVLWDVIPTAASET